ncbi:hypothetical protein V2H45_05610 [Tumidithrix elongata RA019]|uniref:Uncharacterized protein n=1 Tax=Tumidithrix elongata BACA0141 TaxID=2716417 RepID=A0AAW9PX86_9CYAN|nr:hypothetical protein [Tumidithrix elongata RA019]
MDKPDSQENTWDFAKLIADYADALTIFQSDSDVKLSSREVLRVLRSRDRIYEALSDRPTISDEFLEKLVALDIELTQQANVICRVEHFERFRENLQPSESAWWWYLEPIAQKSRFEIFFDQYDWMWNLGTFFCLVLATSFATQTAKAFSEDGFDLLGTFSTLGQGAGLAFVASGALTGGGRQYVSRILISVKISGSLHAVVTFGVALILLASSFAFNKNLNLVGHWYFDQAQQREKRGEWSQAFKDYKRALNFSPDDYVTQIASGFLHEKLGNFDQAIEIYKKGSAFGIPEFWNAQARAMLMSAWQKNNWQGEIDQKVLSEIENLLQRAEAAVDQAKQKNRQPEDVDPYTEKENRLSNDVDINKAILTLAKIKLGEKLSENEKFYLIRNAFSLYMSGAYAIQDVKLDLSQANQLTQVSTLGKPRAECFWLLHSDFTRIIDPWQTFGNDYLVHDYNRAYHCQALLSFATFPDVLWLRNYFSKRLERVEDLQSITRFSKLGFFNQIGSTNFYLGNNNKSKIIQEPQIWLNLASKLAQMIELELAKFEAIPIAQRRDGRISFRVLIDKNGQIIDFIAGNISDAYVLRDRLAFLSEALKKESIEQLLSKLKSDTGIEVADFKVLISNDGKKIVQIIPWASIYPGANEFCNVGDSIRSICRHFYVPSNIRDTFPNYITNDQDRTKELEYNDRIELESVLYKFIPVMAVPDWSAGIINYSSDKLSTFKLTVSADGQIVDYKPIAISRHDQALNLKKLPFPQLLKKPYTDFKISFKNDNYLIEPLHE